MSGYARQSSFADSDVIEAADHNNEYNQLVAAFDEVSGHKHDGTADEGPVIGLIGDAGDTTPTNKVEVDTAGSNVGVWIDVAGTSVEQVIFADGKIEPVTDNDIDLGSATKEFKDLYLDGVAYVDAISFNGSSITGIIDDDTMATASATTVASSESIKAYADGLITALGTVGDLISTNNLSDISNAVTARSNLGLTIGTHVQAYDAMLNDIAALTDPNADRILFWDDSLGAVTWLSVGSGMSISGTEVTATGTAASSATTTTEGIVELATTAEVTTGTDTSRAVTPAALENGYNGSTNVTTLGTITTGVWNATDIPLSAGGTGASLTDPNADRILFWDDSLGAMTWLTVGTDLQISGTTLSSTAGSSAASTTVAGIVELATTAEVTTGTDTARAVTPDALNDGYLGTTNVTTLGTITTGTWNGSAIPMTHGGTGASLADPNADRILFWDDSATAMTWLTVGGNLTITGTTLSDGTITTVGTISTGAWQADNIALAYGGTGTSLIDPNADRIMFWDDSASSVAWLTAGSGLSLSGTTLTAAVSNSNWSGTDLAVVNGGTGASTAADARTNLGAQETLSGASLTAVTVAADDKVIIQDASDSSNIKTVTTQSIADLAPSGWVLLDSIDSQAAAQTSLAFADGIMTDSYDNYLVVFEELYRTDSTTGTSLEIQVKTTGWVISSSYNSRNYTAEEAIPAPTNYSSILAGGYVDGSSASASTKAHGHFFVRGARNTAINTHIVGEISGDAAVGAGERHFFEGDYDATTAVTTLRFACNTGNIAIRARIYGMKN